MKRIYFNEDNHHFYGYHPPEDMTVEGCRKLIDTYAETGTIKGLLFCANVQRALFDSDKWERFRDIDDPDPYVRNLRLLSERGIDQFAVWLQRSRELGIEGWLTMRMNDSHGLKEAETGAEHWIGKWPSEYWRRNPQLRRAPYRMERSWEGSFNYLLPEVRAHHLALIEELFERYDMFGLELDWMRWGMFFPPGFEHEGAGVLTEFVREVRSLADAAAACYGHPVKLGHRLPADPAACSNFGFDPVDWGENGCVDMVTLSSFLGNADFNPRIDLWRRLLPTDAAINVFVENCVKPYPGEVVNNDEIMFGSAAAAWSCGADGIYFFNECYLVAEDVERLQYKLAAMSSPDALQRTVRRFPVTCPMVTIPGDTARRVLPVPLEQKTIGSDFGRMEQNITLRLPAGKVLPDAKCLLRLAFCGDADHDQLLAMPVRVNTTPVVPGKWPDAATFYIARPYHTRYPSLPEKAAFALIYEVPAGLLHETFNAVEFEPPPIPGELVWAELMVL